MAELLTVGEANGMCTSQGHHFLRCESFGLEKREHFRYRHGRCGEVAVHSRRLRNEAVFSAEANLVVGAADHDDEITGGDGEDVGAGDNAGTLDLDGDFGAGDEVEGVAWEGKVDVGVALGGVEGVGGDEDGGVAAFDHAVVEEEAESGGSCGGVVDLLGAYDLPHNGFEQRACFVVVSGAELGLCVGKK